MTSYILNKMIDRYENSRNDWKEQSAGNRSIPVQQSDYDACGRSELLQEARQLEKKGLIKVKWFAGGNDIERIAFRLEALPRMYELTGRRPKSQRMADDARTIREWMDQARSDWLRQYYQDLADSVHKGKRPQDMERCGEKLFQCLNCLEKLESPMYIRIFSSRYLGGSKVFERELESRVVSIARKYHPMVDEAMEKYQVLSQLYLDNYSQEMALKGGLRFWLEGRLIDLSAFRYGTVLNTETLRCGKIHGEQKIRKIITVENKANFVSMPYEDGTLIIFSHGFFSPLEREFLKALREVLPDEGTEYYHTGDLDYGGVRIFQYIRRKIFPRLQPLQMDEAQYEAYKDFAVDMEPSSWEKLKDVEEPALEPLIRRILAEKKVIEQECFL